MVSINEPTVSVAHPKQADDAKDTAAAQAQAPKCPELQTIAKIRDEVSCVAHKINCLEIQFDINLARVCVAIWRYTTKKIAPSAQDSIVTTAIARVKRTSYDAGCLGLELERKLFSLDGVYSEEFHDQVRAARRQLVQVIKGEMKKSDALMNKTKIYKTKFFLGDVASKFLQEERTGEPMQTPSPIHSPTPSPTASAPPSPKPPTHSESSETEEQECPQAAYEPQETVANTDGQMEEGAANEPAETESWRMGETTRWRPQFHQRRTTLGIALVADMGGVDKETLSVSQGEGRSIVVRGVKPYQKLHRAYTHHVQPYGWFEESFVIPKGYSMNVKTHLDRQYLIINISAPPREQSLPRTARACPFSSYFDQPQYSRPQYSRSYSPERRGFGSPFGTSLFGF